MRQQLLEGLSLLKEQIKKYIEAPMRSRIIPLIGFLLYLSLIPQILFIIIPLDFSHNQFFSQQVAKTIVYIFCLTLVNSLTVMVYSTFIYFVYTKKINLEKYRISLEQKWPWEENPKNWDILLKKTIKTIIMNTNIFGVITLIIWALIFPRKVIVSPQIPSYYAIFWQFMLFMIVEDCTSTLTHTLLHSPQLYWIHKKHHEYTTTVSIAAEYAHPIQFIFSNSVPTIIGFKVLAYSCPVHIVTALTWLIYRILLTSDLHSGYEFPWDFYRLLPFTAPASYHDYHHSHNVGNFASSFMVIQALIGHNKEYYKYISKKERNNYESSMKKE